MLHFVAVRLVEESYIGIAGTDLTRVFHSLWNEVVVTFGVGSLDSIYDQIYPPFQYDAPLALMRVLWQLDILSEFHEYDLMMVCLREIRPNPPQWNVGLRKTSYGFGEYLLHC